MIYVSSAKSKTILHFRIFMAEEAAKKILQVIED